MSEDANPAAASPPKKARSRKPLIVAVLGLLLASGAGAVAWFKFAPHAKPAGGVAAEEEKKAPRKQHFTTLDTFTVNLQDPRGERFAQVGVTLQFEDPSVEMTIKDQLPAVRNDILLLLSSKQLDDLLSVDGKRQLADQIRERAGRAIGYEPPAAGASAAQGARDNPVRAVLFSQFIVQ